MTISISRDLGKFILIVGSLVLLGVLINMVFLIILILREGGFCGTN